jgi:hypothetical protein
MRIGSRRLVSTLLFSLFAGLIPRASALPVPVAGLTIEVSGSYCALFLFGGAATLAALVPLAFSPSPESGARLTR